MTDRPNGGCAAPIPPTLFALVLAVLLGLAAPSSAAPSAALEHGTGDTDDRFGAVLQKRTERGGTRIAAKNASSRLLAAPHSVLDMASGAPLVGLDDDEVLRVCSAKSIASHADLQTLTAAGL